VRGLLQFSRYDLLLLEAGSCGREQIANPEEGTRRSLEAAAEQRLGKSKNTLGVLWLQGSPKCVSQ
jgi:hypothetical protein